MVKSHQVQNGGVQIVNVDPVFHSGQAEFIGRSIAEARFDTPSCHPNGETIVVVVSALLSLRGRRPTKFTAPNHQGLIKKPPLLEVFNQGGNSLIASPRRARTLETSAVFKAATRWRAAKASR